jgi:hypothetical protein
MPQTAHPLQPLDPGGSFAHPLTAEKLAKYRELAGEGSPAVKDSVLSLCDMVEAYLALPEPKGAARPHGSGEGRFQDLDQEQVEALWQVVPWPHEANAMQRLFDDLPARSPLRDAAFHLVWYAQKLSRDLVPWTKDRLPSSGKAGAPPERRK